MAISRQVVSIAKCARLSQRFIIYSASKGEVECVRVLIFSHLLVSTIYEGLAQVIRVGDELTFY